MADHRITDFVDQAAIDSLKRLKEEMDGVRRAYVDAANELVKGLKVNVDGLDQLDRMNRQLAQTQQQAAAATQRHAAALEQQQTIVDRTTAAISRELDAQDKANQSARKAYERQDEVRQVLSTVTSKYNDMTRQLAEIAIKQDKLNNLKREEKKAFEDGKITQEQYTQTLQKIIKAQQALAAEKSRIEAYAKSEVKENQSVGSSYNAMSQELARLKKAYRELSQEDREGEIGQGMLDNIRELSNHLKDLDQTMGDYQRNVGNYAIAGQSAKQQLRELVTEIATLTMQYRELSDEEKASAEGQEMSEHIQQLTEEAGQLRDAIADTNAAIGNAASDTRGIDQVTAGVKLLVDSFGFATGAAQMLGLSEEDLVVVQTKLQAAIAASNALKGIQTALQKESALMQGVEIIQTKAHALAIEIKTAAEGKGVIVTKAATVAQAAFNAVASMNPYVLLATAIIGAVAAIAGLIIANKKAAASEEEAKKASEARAAALEKERDAAKRFAQTVGDTAGAQISALLNLSRQWKALGKDISAQKRFITDNAKEFEKLGFSVTSVTDAEKILDKQTNTVIQIIIKRARAAAYAQAMTAAWAEAIATVDSNRTTKYVPAKAGMAPQDLTKGELAALQKAGQSPYSSKNGVQTYSKLNESQAGIVSDYRKEQAMNAARDRQKAAMDTANEKTERYAKEMTSLNGQVATMTKSLGVATATPTAPSGSGRGGTASTAAETAKEAQTYEELREIAIKNKKESIDKQIELEQEGSEKWKSLKKESLEIGAHLELESVRKTTEKTLAALDESLGQGNITKEQYAELEHSINEETAEKALAIRRKLQADIKEVEETGRTDYIELAADRLASEQTIANERLRQQQIARKKQYIEELKDAKDNAMKREEIERKYNEDMKALSAKAATANAKAAVDALEEILKKEDLTADEREQITKKLAEAKVAYEEASTDEIIALLEKVKDKDDDNSDKMLDNLNKYLGKASEMIGAVGSLISTLYDSRIQKIEDEQEASSEAAEAEAARVDELVEKKVITEEEGEARKRAAEQKTALKQEQLERKKAELQRKQAIYEKAVSIAQAVIATGQSILESSKMGFPAAIPFVAMAAALGAVQIATIAATPIPKYAEGTGYHKGGLAIVGDGGRSEVVEVGGAMYITPDKPTLIDMPKGAAVYPDAQMLDTLDAVKLTGSPRPQVVVNNDYRSLEHKLDELAWLIKVQTATQKRSADNTEYSILKARL